MFLGPRHAKSVYSNTYAVLIGSKRLMDVHASFQCIFGVFVFAVADLVNLLGKIQSS